MVISAIEQAKKNIERVNLSLDGEFWVGLDKNQLIQFGLHKGKVINLIEKQEIESASSFQKLVDKVIKLTMIRPRSKHEVLQYLTIKKGVEEPMANKVVDFLEVKSFLSDDEFAKWYIQNRTSHGFHGPNKIFGELLKKGVARNIINLYLKESKEREDNSKKILQLFEKIKDKIKYKSKSEYKNKVYKRLISRGYSFQEVKSAIDDLLV